MTSFRIYLPLSAIFVFVIASVSAQDIKLRNDVSEADRTRVEKVTKPTSNFIKAERFEKMSAGAGTNTRVVDENAFSEFLSNLDFEGEEKFKLGNGLFRKLWVSSPSSTQASDGLGPLFNARSCQRCHLKDGRGHPPENADDSRVSMFLRLSISPQNDDQRAQLASGEKLVIPEPTYGGQLQDLAIPGAKGEGRMQISYHKEIVTLADGEIISLRRPVYSITDLAYGPLHPDVQMSPRIAPPMIGLGLLEAIHSSDILAMADPEDRDNNGISGKISWLNEGGARVIGRFGWKASAASVIQQSADAFAGDIGLSSPLAPRHWGDCTAHQKECLSLPSGVQINLGDTEAPDPVLELVAFYSKNLAVPARRNVGAKNVLKGKEIFYAIGCQDCHRAKYVTSRDADQKEHRFQLIWPYTDLLLHDMGGGLADNRPVGHANGREWRTAPLWGIGLTQTVNGHSYFLHDGRARNLTEAILWHGGEAQHARDNFANLAKQKREQLLSFLESL